MMRIAVLIIGLLLGAVMFLQTFLLNALGQASQDKATEEAAAGGLFMAVLWLVACGLVLPLPMVSVILFSVAGVIGLALSGDFRDLAIWGGISIALAVLSFFGWLGKRKQQRELRAERARQLERDQRMETMLQQQSRPQPTSYQIPCPSCERLNSSGTRFCGNCGTLLAPAQA